MKYHISYRANVPVANMGMSNVVECDTIIYNGEWIIFQKDQRDIFILSSRSRPIITLQL